MEFRRGELKFRFGISSGTVTFLENRQGESKFGFGISSGDQEISFWIQKNKSFRNSVGDVEILLRNFERACQEFRLGTSSGRLKIS